MTATSRCVIAAPRWEPPQTIALPQTHFVVVTSALLSFLTSLDEGVIAMFISGGNNPTPTRNIFNAMFDQIDVIVATTLMVALARIISRAQSGG